MKSLAYIPASNQAANASLMTVQTVRASGASDIIVNTVTGASTKFYASMGAPHTFIDPATGETITIISEATAVDFAGHLDSGKVVIDAIAPGYVDTRGSLVGDIVVIRPITEWANNIFNVLSESLNDDGTIKNSAITYDFTVFDYIASGAVLAGLGYGANLNVSLSAGVCYINGTKQIISAVASRGYTASKDTYVDALYNANGTATIVYTEVANNAASPALAANSIRLGIVITGASNVLNVGSINQGETGKILPIASSQAYQVTDSLGNLIAPRDPSRKVLGYRQISADSAAAAAGSTTNVTGLSVPFIAPLGRKIKTRVVASQYFSLANDGAGQAVVIREGATTVALAGWVNAGVNFTHQVIPEAILTPSVGLHTYVAGLAPGGAAMTLKAGPGAVAFIVVELD